MEGRSTITVQGSAIKRHALRRPMEFAARICVHGHTHQALRMRFVAVAPELSSKPARGLARGRGQANLCSLSAFHKAACSCNM
jgi:hypothetical protein